MLTTVAGFVVTACSGLSTDYSAESQKLDTEISAMPGVQRCEVTVKDDFFLGDSYLRFAVHLSTATDEQIGDVATRMRERLRTLDGLRERELEFVVADRATVRAARELDVDALRETVRNVRRYTESVPDARIFWEMRPIPRIAITDVKTGAAEPLGAVRDMLGPTGQAEVRVDAADSKHWSVTLPLAADREAELQRQLSEITWDVQFVEIADGHIHTLTLREKTPSTVDPALSYDALSAAVRLVAPTPDHSLRLTWNWFFYYTEGKRNEGFVHAAACDYALSTVSEDALTARAVGVQRRMREEFDTC
ncbi:hypothetical protein [Nocardia sp. NPDC057668]|uniref:hypothetical protein n=1 Tax=Nocardia sp. NPDC057668 TaxID=3346202 RepID=UPI00367160BE